MRRTHLVSRKIKVTSSLCSERSNSRRKADVMKEALTRFRRWDVQKRYGAYKARYKNSKFSGEKVGVDGNFYANCEFEDCLIIVEKGETDLRGCKLKNCKLMLKGNAYTVGKITKLFTGTSPLKVLDFDEPLFEEAVNK